MALKTLAIATRTLRKHPAFTATAVLTIALGIGASTAIFSVMHAVLLRPLPYRDPARLIIAGMDLRKRNVQGLPFSNADFIDLREGTKAQFSDVAGVFTGRRVVPKEDGTPEQIRWAIVTTNFFQVMGGQILYGRDFVADDGVPQTAPANAAANAQPPQLPQTAILSYEYFQKRYGGNPAILGHTMVTPGQPSPVIVGVVAPGFRLYFPPDANEETAPDIWIANRLGYDAAQRNDFSIRPIGRLRDGVTVQQAQAAADAVAERGRETFPIDKTAGYFITLAPMQAHLVAEVRPALLALMGSVIFLLLIACANVANLLLVRASLREPEFAVRAALGANQWKLTLPLFTEACLLAFAGTLLGLALAWAGIYELRALAPANLPRLDEIHLDGTVLAFTALTGLLSAALFGLLPAWRASQPGLMILLRGTGRTSGLASGATIRNMVVMTEVALSFVLLIGSGLMFRSFLDLQRINPGFDPNHLLTFQVLGNVLNPNTTPEQRAAKMRTIEQQLRSIPGVENVTASYPFPLTGNYSPIRWGTEAALTDPSRFQAVDWQLVLPGYFETMRLPLLAGRTLTEEDNLPTRSWVVIDDVLAKKAFPGQSAVGKRILIRLRSPQPEWVQIAGVVGHQRESSLSEPGREQIYFAEGFLGSGLVRTWALRTRSNPASYESQVRAAIADVDRTLLVSEMQPAESVVSQAQASTRFSLLLITVFAVVAGTLAAVGLYGVLATAVRQRTSEIGVRMALGAQRGDILRLIILQGLRLSAVGITLGIVAAIVLGRVMTSMLVGVKPTDPATFAGITAVFLTITILASWLPARRAAGLDPKTALHEN